MGNKTFNKIVSESSQVLNKINSEIKVCNLKLMAGMYLTRINVLRNTLIGLTLLITIADASANYGIGFVAGPTYGL